MTESFVMINLMTGIAAVSNRAPFEDPLTALVKRVIGRADQSVPGRLTNSLSLMAHAFDPAFVLIADVDGVGVAVTRCYLGTALNHAAQWTLACGEQARTMEKFGEPLLRVEEPALPWLAVTFPPTMTIVAKRKPDVFLDLVTWERAIAWALLDAIDG